MAEEKSPPVVTLVTLADGAALELFQAELDRLLRNIADRNTDWKGTRKITLEFVFKTNEEREVGDVAVKASSKLAGLKGAETIVYFGRHKGELVAMEHNPKQAGLFDQGSHIKPMPVKGGRE